jgi:type II secretory pathway component PulJ
MPLPISAIMLVVFAIVALAAYRFLTRQRRAIERCERTYQRLRRRRVVQQ